MVNQESRILYFTRRPEIEAKAKRLVQNPRQNSQVIKYLYDWTKSSIQQSSIPFVELNETQQYGATFGEKLANGIQALIDDGVTNVIVLGNDSPDLEAADLTAALACLEEGSQVVGHNFSGGSWIIGIKSEHFDKTEFEKLPWQTAALGSALTSLFESQGKLSSLASIHDINDSEDFLSLLKSNANTGFWALMRACLSINFPSGIELSLAHQSLSIAQPSLRAPPVFFVL